MVGDPGGEMRWDDVVSRAEASKILVTGLGFTRDLGNAARTDSTFRDLAQEHWAYGYIRVVEDRGILRGYGDATCGPDLPVTAAEFGVMLSRGYVIIAGPGAPRVEYRVDPEWAGSDLGDAPPILEELRAAFPSGASFDFPLTRTQCVEIAFRVLRRMGLLYDVVGTVSGVSTAEGALSVTIGSGTLKILMSPDADFVDGWSLTSLSGLHAGDTVGVVLGEDRKGVLVVVEAEGRP
jgi:hypothetical protein